MDTNKLTAEHINKLTAQYILRSSGGESAEAIDQRLQMALHVYEAMPTVRQMLIEDIFKIVGESIRTSKKLHEGQLEIYERSVYFCTEETGDFWIFAALVQPRQPQLWLRAGVYAEYADDAKPLKVQEDEIRASLRQRCNLETWSSDRKVRDDGRAIAYSDVRSQAGGGRWDKDYFLKRAIRQREGLVKELTHLLTIIYGGVFPLASK